MLSLLFLFFAAAWSQSLVGLFPLEYSWGRTWLQAFEVACASNGFTCEHRNLSVTVKDKAALGAVIESFPAGTEGVVGPMSSRQMNLMLEYVDENPSVPLTSGAKFVSYSATHPMDHPRLVRMMPDEAESIQAVAVYLQTHKVQNATLVYQSDNDREVYMANPDIAAMVGDNIVHHTLVSSFSTSQVNILACENWCNVVREPYHPYALFVSASIHLHTPFSIGMVPRRVHTRRHAQLLSQWPEWPPNYSLYDLALVFDATDYFVSGLPSDNSHRSMSVVQMLTDDGIELGVYDADSQTYVEEKRPVLTAEMESLLNGSSVNYDSPPLRIGSMLGEIDGLTEVFLAACSYPHDCIVLPSVGSAQTRATAIREANLDVLIGPVQSLVSSDLAGILYMDDVTIISPSATDTMLNSPVHSYSRFYRTCGSDFQEGYTAAHLAKNYGWNNVAFVAPDKYDNSVCASIMEGFASLDGMNVLGAVNVSDPSAEAKLEDMVRNYKPAVLFACVPEAFGLKLRGVGSVQWIAGEVATLNDGPVAAPQGALGVMPVRAHHFEAAAMIQGHPGVPGNVFETVPYAASTVDAVRAATSLAYVDSLKDMWSFFGVGGYTVTFNNTEKSDMSYAGFEIVNFRGSSWESIGYVNGTRYIEGAFGHDLSSVIFSATRGSTTVPPAQSHTLRIVGVFENNTAMERELVSAFQVACGSTAYRYKGNYSIVCDHVNDTALSARDLSVDRPLVAVGPMLSTTAIRLVEELDQAQLPMISPGATADRLTASTPYFFRTVPSDTSFAGALAELVYSAHDRPEVVVIHTNDPYHRNLMNAFRNTHLTLEVVKEIEIVPGSWNTADVLLKVRQTGINTVVMLIDESAVYDMFVGLADANMVGGEWLYFLGDAAGSISNSTHLSGKRNLAAIQGLQGVVALRQLTEVNTPHYDLFFSVWENFFPESPPSRYDAPLLAQVVNATRLAIDAAIAAATANDAIVPWTPPTSTQVQQQLASRTDYFSGGGDPIAAMYDIVNFQGSHFVKVGTITQGGSLNLTGQILYPGGRVQHRASTSPYCATNEGTSGLVVAVVVLAVLYILTLLSGFICIVRKAAVDVVHQKNVRMNPVEQ
jgi:ABC-type branched-subunit amino acid transport system substrate-binding protein